MAYTNLQLLRKELADPYKSAFDQNTGDGETTIFKLSHGNVKSGSYEVSVADALQTETTHYTIDLEEGIVTFLTAPADTLEVEVEYQFSAFSDTELTEFLTLEGSVNGALLKCIDILLMDSARRFDYSVGRADLKPSQVFDNLLKLRDVIEKKIKSEASGGGVILANRTSRFYEGTETTESDLSRADL